MYLKKLIKKVWVERTRLKSRCHYRLHVRRKNAKDGNIMFGKLVMSITYLRTSFASHKASYAWWLIQQCAMDCCNGFFTKVWSKITIVTIHVHWKLIGSLSFKHMVAWTWSSILCCSDYYLQTDQYKFAKSSQTMISYLSFAQDGKDTPGYQLKNETCKMLLSLICSSKFEQCLIPWPVNNVQILVHNSAASRDRTAFLKTWISQGNSDYPLLIPNPFVSSTSSLGNESSCFVICLKEYIANYI
jgi:hypothetical protein